MIINLNFLSSCILAFLFFFPSHCFGNEVLILKNDTQVEDVNQFIQILEDKTKQLSVKEISTETFKIDFNNINHPEENLGFSQSVFWLKLSIRNSSQIEDWYLKQHYSANQYLDLYQRIDEQNFQVEKSGFLSAYSTKAIKSRATTFKITLAPNESKTFYFKYKSNSPVQLKFSLYSTEAFYTERDKNSFSLGGFFAPLFIMLLMNIVFYLITRLKSQLYTAIYISAALFSQALMDGLFLVILPESFAIHLTFFSFLFNNLACLALFFFCYHIHYLKKLTKHSELIKYTVISYHSLLLLMQYFVPSTLTYQLNTFSFIVTPLLCLSISIHAWKQHQKYARFICLGLFFLTATDLAQTLPKFFAINSSFAFIDNNGKTGIILMILFLSLAMGAYIRTLKIVQRDAKTIKEKTEQRFSQIFEQTSQMLFILSETGNIESVNSPVEKFFNKNKIHLLNQNFNDIFPTLKGGVDKDIIKQHIQSAISGELKTQTFEAYAHDQTIKNLEVTYQPFVQANKLINNVIVQVRDNTKQTQAFKAIQGMVVGIASFSSDNFFKSFLIEISRIYNAKYVMFSLINQTNTQTATSIAIIEDKKLIPNITFATKGTPTELLLNQHLCNYPTNACQTFPNDEWLNKHNIESYLGVNIRDADNNIIGFLSVMNDKPMHEDNYFIEVLDIFSSRVANELLQQESQEDLKQALDKVDFHITNTPLAVIEWDTDFNIINWNKSAERMFGYSIEYFDNNRPLEVLVPEEQKAEVHCLTKELLSNSGGLYSLNKNITAEGRTILCEWHNTPLLNKEGKVIGIASLVNDVTAEHDALNALYIKEHEQREIFNAMLDAVFIVNHKGIITLVNDSVSKLFNYSREELISKNISMLMPPEYKKLHKKYIDRFISSDESRIVGFGNEFQGRRKSDEVFPIHLSVAKLPKDKTKNHRLIITCHDLTEFKQQQATIRQTQKLDALGNLTGGIAHDFNNLLGIINGYSELLTHHIEPDSKLIKYAQHIQKASIRGAKLTKKLLSFASKNTIETEIININDMLLDEFDMLQKTITPRINLTYSLHDELPLTNIDKAELEDCILNLTINAMHAISSHGEILISTNLVEIDNSQAILHHIKEGKYISLSIKDDGKGMDEITQQKALEPFFTTKGKTGTGLGLSQVYGFIERSKGCVQLESILGKGTQITLLLPLITNHKKKNSNKSNVEQLTLPSSTILVVDDEPSLVELSSTILTNAGYHVISASSGKEALEKLALNTIDVILCDIIMPNMDGITLAKIVNKKHPKIDVLFVSGYHDHTMSEGQEELQHKILTKPYRASELLHRVSKVLSKKL